MMLKTRIEKLEQALTPLQPHGRFFLVAGGDAYTSEDITEFMAANGITRLETDFVVHVKPMRLPGEEPSRDPPLGWCGPGPRPRPDKEARAE